MKSNLADYLQIILPHLSPEIAAPTALSHLQKLAHLSAPIPRAGFEIRLDKENTQVDLQQGIYLQNNEPRILAQHINNLALSHQEFKQPAWDSIRQFCELWSDSNSSLYHKIAEFWLEFDINDAESQLLIPSIFIGIKPDYFDSEEAFNLIKNTLELLWQKPINDSLYRNLYSCFTACIAPAKISHVGIMLSRQVEVLRLNISKLPPYETISYLQKIGYPYPLNKIENLVIELLDIVDNVRLCLDVGTDIYPQIGLECYFNESSGLDPRWLPFLDNLIAQGLCTPQKRDALINWVGFTTPNSSVQPWATHLIAESLLQTPDSLSVLERGLSHIKITYKPQYPLQAKAYLGFIHRWLKPNSVKIVEKFINSSSSQENEVKSLHSQLNEAITAAINFLLNARNQGGWWRDFNFKQDGGRSDEWVTAYVGTALTTQPDTQAQQAAQWAWNLLAKRRQITEGWGYNPLAPADADSTIWALQLANALGEWNCERVQKTLDFLEQHLDINGGIATYLETLARPYVEMKYQYTPGTALVDGWCSPHPCVTAAAANLEHFGETSVEFLRQTQRDDGSWQGYWWHDDDYATALATQALARKRNPKDIQRVQLAIEWAAKRINGNGAVYSTVHGNDSPFATALCVKILNLADSEEEKKVLLQQAVNWLIENQLSNGSWESSAIFRLPHPAVINPNDCKCHNFPDDRRLFTTATVLAALSGVQRSAIAL
ncbi:prenyltransferase/squalene oxidase repeat-containing protein [Nostoc sp.]|uniref:prenyltransferase/squalene oxidase repeat-containing protein n=1 Tax=Nostoc sp. TaxID=1180 RepID=UPI002FFAFDBC